MKQYRHGDLFIKEIPNYPPNARLVKAWVEDNEVTLLRGEATGHAHKLKGDFDLLRDKNNTMYFEVKTKAYLSHEEHKRIDLPAGKYTVIRQREYTPKEIVYVRD